MPPNATRPKMFRTSGAPRQYQPGPCPGLCDTSATHRTHKSRDNLNLDVAYLDSSECLCKSPHTFGASFAANSHFGETSEYESASNECLPSTRKRRSEAGAFAGVHSAKKRRTSLAAIDLSRELQPRASTEGRTGTTVCSYIHVTRERTLDISAVILG